MTANMTSKFLRLAIPATAALSVIAVTANPALAANNYVSSAKYTAYTAPTMTGTLTPSDTGATGSETYTSTTAGALSVTSTVTSPNDGADTPATQVTYMGGALVLVLARLKPSATGYTVTAHLANVSGRTSNDESTAQVSLQVDDPSCSSCFSTSTHQVLVSGAAPSTTVLSVTLPPTTVNVTRRLMVGTDAFTRLSTAGSASTTTAGNVTSISVAATRA